eukprot:TRINITY_DN13537_c0_g1_i4.p2 TRINITY_DN13537_c0_g1~~TRINITY_DN13537_c0_g1_i4.p2  ORF type:complete len:233 (-),score=59.01 TRINITY_DN13537_c0_g1_i4:129-827(-)
MYPHLSWLHDIKIEDFQRCSATTSTLGIEETENVAQRKVLLSIQKLADIISKDDDSNKRVTEEERVKTVEDQLRDMIVYQEHLGDFVSLSGINVIKPMSPEEAIRLLLALERGSIPIKDFHFAFDIFSNTRLLQSPEKELEVITFMWQRVLDADDWDKYAGDWNQKTILDEELRNSLGKTTLCKLLRDNEDLIDLLPTALLATITEKYSNKVVVRLQLTTYEMVVSSLDMQV